MIRTALRGRPLGSGEGTTFPGLEAPPGDWTVERSYRYCEEIVRSHYENFPVASRFVPARLRPHMWAVYAYARSADDFADEPRFAGRRAQALEYWDHELHRCFHGEAEHPVFIALRDTAEKCDLPITPLEDLLTSFRMDLSVHRYPTYSDLRGFTRLSAEPVGRTVLYVFGYRDPSLHRYSDELCTALQQANFWQDVAVDLARDRIYLPAEDLHHFGVSEDDLHARREHAPLRNLLRFEVARTRSLFERGRPLCDLVGRDLGFELKLIWLAGMRVLEKLEAARFAVFSRRPVLGLPDKAKMVTRAAAWTAGRWRR
ncbi:MAG TPA: squalene synthase HpnC [Polyangia bacterium]|nr:squalene synthase HpnC [Polyangia bacterium]